MSKIETKLVTLLLDCEFPVRSYNGKLSVKTLNSLEEFLGDVFLSLLDNHINNRVVMEEIIYLLRTVERDCIGECNIFYFPDVNY